RARHRRADGVDGESEVSVAAHPGAMLGADPRHRVREEARREKGVFEDELLVVDAVSPVVDLDPEVPGTLRRFGELRDDRRAVVEAEMSTDEKTVLPQAR